MRRCFTFQSYSQNRRATQNGKIKKFRKQ